MATPLINGINYSWGNITVIGLGVPFIGIRSIEYKSMQEKTNNYGAGNKPTSRGYGRVEYEGSIEISVDDWKRIIAASPNRDPLQIPAFDIAVVFAGTGVLPTTETLRSVEFLENPFTAAEGDTLLTVTIPLIIGDIER
jgi:hypothetical protein